ncbi:4-vinyl reductase 4VR [Isosphaera pallida ATCC 43644]|uniref:4-vinyl reductase 4VR n=1 Tax=Isosphaera pallida (strain ATCC 43644 / DSM 9630 / IS1B) TaxID=575540 RepID=E8R539_ISOPI|nr:V4R domain-containing protein [Isosphaera pallida]ADV62796.1 4-vinyl reductase 4VR [Isosphaera pallida ATCC 43644]
MATSTTSTTVPAARGNYYAEGSYTHTDVKTGVTRNRVGTRICCLTSDFLIGFRKAIIDECGPAADGVFYSCGKTWGKGFAKRFETELSEFYGGPLVNAPMSLFEACLTEAASHHGWGRLSLDCSHYDKGVLVVTVKNAIMASLIGASETPADSLLAGTFAGFFSHFAGFELECVQTQCAAMGHPESKFVISHPQRLTTAADQVRQKVDHNTIVAGVLETKA